MARLITLSDIHTECECDYEAFFFGETEERADRLYFRVRCLVHGAFVSWRRGWADLWQRHTELASAEPSYHELAQALLSYDTDRLIDFVHTAYDTLRSGSAATVPFFRAAELPAALLSGEQLVAILLGVRNFFPEPKPLDRACEAAIAVFATGSTRAAEDLAAWLSPDGAGHVVLDAFLDELRLIIARAPARAGPTVRRLIAALEERGLGGRVRKFLLWWPGLANEAPHLLPGFPEPSFWLDGELPARGFRIDGREIVEILNPKTGDFVVDPEAARRERKPLGHAAFNDRVLELRRKVPGKQVHARIFGPRWSGVEIDSNTGQQRLVGVAKAPLSGAFIETPSGVLAHFERDGEEFLLANGRLVALDDPRLTASFQVRGNHHYVFELKRQDEVIVYSSYVRPKDLPGPPWTRPEDADFYLHLYTHLEDWRHARRWIAHRLAVEAPRP